MVRSLQHHVADGAPPRKFRGFKRRLDKLAAVAKSLRKCLTASPCAVDLRKVPRHLVFRIYHDRNAEYLANAKLEKIHTQ